MGLGVVSVAKVHRPSELMLASIPIAFSLQQFSEGILWYCLDGSGIMSCSDISTIVFVNFGQVFWPLWIPASIFLLESNGERKKILGYLTILGSVMSLTFLFLTFNHQVTPEIYDHHIHYNIIFPEFLKPFRFLYLVPTVLPSFLSSNKMVKGFGLLLLISYLLSLFIADNYIFSVWCFFAAVASVYIYFVMRSMYPALVTQVHNRT